VDCARPAQRLLPKKGLLGASPDLDRLLQDQFKIDAAKANGSSIAFLASTAARRPPARRRVPESSLHPSSACSRPRQKKLKVDAVKVAHHGSKNNTNDELLALIDCPTT